jgi:hypothetical protein
MLKRMTRYEAAESLKGDEGATWSRMGALALVDYLFGLEDEMDEEMIWDRVAVRCDYTEYASLQEACDDYGIPIEEAEDNGTIIRFDGGVIVSWG